MNRTIKSVTHKIIGHLICRVLLVFWDIRDILFPPKEKSILFVTHPDDDTLFFHTFIQEYKPYVVVMTAGYSVNRLKCFSSNMKQYGVRYRAYDHGTDDIRPQIVSRRARHMFQLGNIEICATHNPNGEYGHHMHKCVHEGVIAVTDCKKILVPIDQQFITEHPLPEEKIKEKENIFNNIYKSELFVLSVWPNWVSNECLIVYENNNK